MNALTLGTSEIRQLDGLYSLNDLHNAAGAEEKHRPNQFIRLDQTQALIAEIETAQICAVKTKEGRRGGTYVCRELVYAYAMWISAKFHLLVIRAFDLMQTGGFRQDITRKALKNGLSLEQCDAVKALHKSRVQALPQAKQAGAAIKLWSSVKSKFGVSYKEVPPEHFAEVLSLIARQPLEGEVLDATMNPQKPTDHPFWNQNEGRALQLAASLAAQIAAHLYGGHPSDGRFVVRLSGTRQGAWPMQNAEYAGDLCSIASIIEAENPDRYKPTDQELVRLAAACNTVMARRMGRLEIREEA